MSFLTRLFGRREEPAERAMSVESFRRCLPSLQFSVWAREGSIRNPGCLCAVRVIAEAFASCPVEIIETVGEEKRIVESHPLAYRLNVEANDEVSALDWKQAAIHHLLLWGNAFSEIVTNGAGEFDHFWLLLPQYTQVLRNIQNELMYRTVLYPSMQSVELERSEVFHVKNLSYDGLIGLAPIQYCRMAFDLSHEQESYAHHWFRNNAKPGGYYEFPNRLSQQAKDNIVASHRKQFAGSHNANSVGILDEGGKFNVTTIPADDGQYLNSRTFQLSEIARVFNINPVFLHDLNATWANLETLNTMFVQKTLIPWIQRFESELKRKVLGNGNLSVHFNCSGLLRGDIATRYTTYATGLQNGFLSINDVRKKEGMQSIGDEGNVYRVQLNMAAGEPGKQTPSKPDPSGKVPQDKVPQDKPEVGK